MAAIGVGQSSLDYVLDYRRCHERSANRMELKHGTLHIAVKLGRRVRKNSMVLHLMPHTFTKNPSRTKITSRRQRRRRIPQHARELDNQDGVHTVVLLQSFLAR